MSAYSFIPWGKRLGQSIGHLPRGRDVDRATKEEVIARLTEAHTALVGAADAMARRYGSSDHTIQLCGAATLITDDWIPDIEAEVN